MELLKEPATHLQLSYRTGINRTKVYRLAAELEKRSLISRKTDDRGTFLTASDPTSLEVRLMEREEALQKTLRLQRDALKIVIPELLRLQLRDNKTFTVQTYRGVEGFQQMLWHELKTKGEMLVLGGATIEQLAPKRQWSERHRAMTIAAGYHIRELLNEVLWNVPFTASEVFRARYTQRRIPKNLLLMDNQTVIYNNTVATYHWREDEKVGLEIVNAQYATMMRQIFEHYWQIATP